MPFDATIDWLHKAVVEAGNRAGVTIERADDIFAPGVIVDQIRSRIEAADAVVAVCTGRNANVFYELGIADAIGHRTILIAESATDLPFDVQHYRAHIYGPEMSAAFVTSRVAAGLSDVIQSGGRSPQATRPQATPRPHLSAALFKSDRRYTLEVVNDGEISLNQVEWSFPEDAQNWHRIDVLPDYPVPTMEPGESIRVPILISIGGPAAVNLGLLGQLEDGTPYSRSQVITPY
jgi:hypothetical protein